jgi:hypothetical protein
MLTPKQVAGFCCIHLASLYVPYNIPRRSVRSTDTDTDTDISILVTSYSRPSFVTYPSNISRRSSVLKNNLGTHTECLQTRCSATTAVSV